MHVHMTNVVKIDIITGHEGKVYLHFILWIIFSLLIYQNTMQYLKSLYSYLGKYNILSNAILLKCLFLKP